MKVALTRQQMFALTGYRTPTIQRVRLGADADGRLTAIAHDVVEQTSTARGVRRADRRPARGSCTRRPTAVRRTGWPALDVPTPSWMRAPGECPGMFALESAMDELAVAAGIDPVELRIRNEPEIEPESGLPFSSPQPRRLPARGRPALRLGRAATRGPGIRRDGRWLVGTGVAASTYPAPAPALARDRRPAGRRRSWCGSPPPTSAPARGPC